MTKGKPTRSRRSFEQEQDATLAPWAVPHAVAGARRLREPDHPFRTAFQRDRARIIHSAAFRRLDGKTQVFLNGTGDHYRTRLTHTIEVASVTRSIARALRLNEDLAEVIALAHDLGHPPCGHTGEEALDHLLAAHGGFDHNAQSLRIVETLEERYPRHRGLNLTWDVREGLRKHDDAFVHPRTGKAYHCPSLEAQVTDLADEIAYSSHDIEDGLDAGLLDTAALSSLQLWQRAVEHAASEAPRTKPAKHPAFVTRCLVNLLVADLIETTSRRLTDSGAQSPQDIRERKEKLARFSPRTRRDLSALRRFLFKHLYNHPAVAGVNRRAATQIGELFECLVRNPAHLGAKARSRIRKDGLERTVGDYVSGMTDRYLAIEHRRLVSRSKS